MEMSIKLDGWARELIVDPLSKQSLIFDKNEEFCSSEYGRKYPIVKGIIDCRFLNNKTSLDQKLWSAGQKYYESWSKDLAIRDSVLNYMHQLDGVREVYEAIPIQGAVLDVGGNYGTLRYFLQSDQKYISCDPFLNVFHGLNKRTNLLKTYPFLLQPMNFVCCDAEFLPFKSAAFHTVHMRSVIDHFANPELALNEAYRVLKDNGSLVIGLYVHGGRAGRVSAAYHIKEASKFLLTMIGIKQFKDYHVWHPTYLELEEIIAENGFRVEKVHWQKGYDETVCYIVAQKQLGLRRQECIR